MLAALLIMLREGFEAALVVAIIYSYIRRIGRRDMMRPMWLGVLVASVLSVGAGIVIHLTMESLEGVARLRAFAAISVFAVVVLTWMIFWMRKHARLIKGELEHSMADALGAKTHARWAVAIAAFAAVLREGLEAALFLIAAATQQSGADVLTGGLIGLALASVAGYLVVLGGRRLPLRQFFTVTGIVLIVFAAGLLSRAVMFLQSSADVAILWNNVYDLTGVAVLTTRTEVGRFLGAMFGWDPRPSIEQLVAYLGYAVGVTVLFLRPGPVAAPKPAPEPAPAAEVGNP